MNKEFKQEGMDIKRLFLCFLKKSWIVLVAAVFGALLSSVVYLLVRAVAMPVQYQAVSQVYVRFIWNPNGDVEQSYNGYTWNALMASDPILDRTMNALQDDTIGKEEVILATKAEILSDLRVLILTFTTDNEEKTKKIQTATEEGLLIYGNQNDEITEIDVIRSEVPKQLLWNDDTIRAGIGGGVLFLLIAIFGMSLYYIWDDSIYVIADAERRYAYPVLGIFVQDKKDKMVKQPYAGEFIENVSFILKKCKKISLLGMDRKEEAENAKRIFDNIMKNEKLDQALETWSMDTIERNSKCSSQIRETDGAILVIPAGKGNGRQVDKTISFLNNQDCKILGILITEADSKFLKAYY